MVPDAVAAAALGVALVHLRGVGLAGLLGKALPARPTQTRSSQAARESIPGERGSARCETWRHTDARARVSQGPGGTRVSTRTQGWKGQGKLREGTHRSMNSMASSGRPLGEQPSPSCSASAQFMITGTDHVHAHAGQQQASKQQRINKQPWRASMIGPPGDCDPFMVEIRSLAIASVACTHVSGHVAAGRFCMSRKVSHNRAQVSVPGSSSA